MDTSIEPIQEQTPGIPLGSTCEYCGAAEGAAHLDGCPILENPAAAQEKVAEEEQLRSDIESATRIYRDAETAEQNAPPEGVQPAAEIRHVKIDDERVMNVLLWRAAEEGVQHPFAVTVPGIPGLEVWAPSEDSALESARMEILATLAMRLEAAKELPQEQEPALDGITGRVIVADGETKNDEDENWYEVGKIVDVDGQPARVVLEEIPEGERDDRDPRSKRWVKQPLIEVGLDELARTLHMKNMQIEEQETKVDVAKRGLKGLETEREKIVREIGRRGGALVQRQLGFGEYDMR